MDTGLLKDQPLSEESVAAARRMAELDPANRAVVDRILSDALAIQRAGRPVQPVSLAHSILKLDPVDGSKMAKALVPSRIPELEEQIDRDTLLALPKPSVTRQDTFVDVIKRRESGRDYTSDPISLNDVSTLLAMACGLRVRLTVSRTQPVPYFNRAPSGGGLMSAHVRLIARNIEGLGRGIYRYWPGAHGLELISQGDVRGKLYEVCALSEWVADAAGVLVIVCDIDRLYWKYGDRGYRLTHLDAGALGQNLHLAATALGLGSCQVFGFFDDDFNFLVGVDGERQFTSLIVPFGKPVPRFLQKRQIDDESIFDLSS